MNVSSISGISPAYVKTTPTVGQTTQKFLWSQVGHDLNSGNLSGAQSAFAKLTTIFDRNRSGATPASSTGTPSTPLRADVQQLSQALQSGNLSDAQAAFAKLSQDAKSAGVGGGGNATTGTVDVLA
jgi:hypothetical protein